MCRPIDKAEDHEDLARLVWALACMTGSSSVFLDTRATDYILQEFVGTIGTAGQSESKPHRPPFSLLGQSLPGVCTLVHHYR